MFEHHIFLLLAHHDQRVVQQFALSTQSLASLAEVTLLRHPSVSRIWEVTREENGYRESPNRLLKWHTAHPSTIH